MTPDKPIARRKTADGKALLLWADGLVTFALGYSIRGVGRARSASAQKSDLRAGWAFMEEACLFDAKEVSTAIRAIRQAFRAYLQGRPGFRGGERAKYYRLCMLTAVEKEHRQ